MGDEQSAEEANQLPTMSDLVSTLQEAGDQKTPERLDLAPTLPTIVRVAGPEYVGRTVDDLSRALNGLVKAQDAYLVPDRIDTMTTEDVSEIMPPLVRELESVIKHASAL